MISVDKLNIRSTDSVLDLGCGDGRNAALVVGYGPRLLVAADIEFARLTDSSRNSGATLPDIGTGCTWICADALRLPFTDESFERAICSLLLYLLPLQPALDELYRVVKHDSLVYVRVPLLAWERAAHAAKLFRQPRDFAYALSHVINGIYYRVTGSQLCNPILGHDGWAMYVPRRRFEEAVRHSGFDVAAILIDRSTSGLPSIEGYLRKA